MFGISQKYKKFHPFLFYDIPSSRQEIEEYMGL